MEEYRNYLDAELKHLDFAPIAFITAKDGKNVREVVDLSQHLFRQANERVTTSKLNEAVQHIVGERMPSFPGGRRAKIYYATQTAVAPPTIVMFVNMPEHVDESYRRFMVNRFREMLPYDEVPIKLEMRGRSGRNADETLDEKSTARAAERPRGGGREDAPPSPRAAEKVQPNHSPSARAGTGRRGGHGRNSWIGGADIPVCPEQGRQECLPHLISLRSLLEEVRQQPFPLLGQEALGMILHAFQRPGLVPHAHDFVMVGPTADFKLSRQGAAPDDQAVIARRRKRIGHAFVDRATIMVN